MTRDMLLKLMSVPDGVWDEYSFQSDPMYRRLSASQKAAFAQGAKAAAEEVLARLAPAGDFNSLYAFLEEKGVRISQRHDADSLSAGTFALFAEPDEIILFPEKYKRAEARLAEEDLAGITQEWDFSKMALAHEIFHLYESEHPDIFTMQKVLCLWKIGPFQNFAGLSSLREIGARRFVRKLFSLSCHPCVIELFMLYAWAPYLGKALYDSIVAYDEEWRAL